MQGTLQTTAKLIAALTALGAIGFAGTSQAAWEAPVRIDTQGEDRGNTTLGRLAAGSNGLATILFFQKSDGGELMLFTRRGGDASAWSAPVQSSLSGADDDESGPVPDNPQPSLEANDAGTAGVVLRARRDIPEQQPPPGPPGSPEFENPQEQSLATTFGGGFPAAVEAPPALKQLLGGNSDPATADRPDVDVDGAGVGHVVAVHDPPGSPGTADPPTPPSDPGPELRYGQFSTTSGNPTAGSEKSDFVLHPALKPPDNATKPYSPVSRPRIDVNENGDVAVSFVARINPQQAQAQQSPPSKLAVFAARMLKSTGSWTEAVQMSQGQEQDNVTDHDVAIAPDGAVTVLFAASPQDENNNIYARRWLPGSSAPRAEEFTEFVSTSESEAGAASSPRVVVDDSGRLTAGWLQGGNTLFSAERTSNWNLPQELSSDSGGFDLAVDAEGTATIAYVEGSVLKARRRATATAWGAADTVSTSEVDSSVAPALDAVKPTQADVFFVQANGSLKSGYGSRFSGAPPTTPEAPPKPDTGDCPGDINLVFGDDSNNSLVGTSERDTVLGGGGDDVLLGAEAGDCVRGQAGNDRIDGEADNDNVSGGDGDDQVGGGDGDDFLTGAAGDDGLDGGEGNDSAMGGDGNDSLDGAGGNDLVSGEAGDDTVRGAAGEDLLGGGEGNDALAGQAGRDALFGHAGDDKLRGGSEADSLLGDVGKDVLRGGNGRGRLYGGTGSDRLFGGADEDRIYGQEGGDRLIGGGGKDLLDGGLDHDRIRGGAGHDQATGDDGNDRLVGGKGKDKLGGGAGHDALRGGKGRDQLVGGHGDDLISGGKGRDRISAGDGEDVMVADDGNRDRISCGPGLDVVEADARDLVGRSCEKVSRPRSKKRRKRSREQARQAVQRLAW